MGPINSFEAATLAELGLFNIAFQHAAVGMGLAAPDGQWLRVNQALCLFLGYSEQELLATTFKAISHPDDLDRLQRQARQLLSGQIEAYQMEKRYLHKNGRTVWGLASVALARDGDGKPLFFIGQVQDITQRKAAEDEARRLNAELRKALKEVKQLRGIIPICSYCKKVRDDANFWHQVERYISDHSGARFSHGICPQCLKDVEREGGAVSSKR